MLKNSSVMSEQNTVIQGDNDRGPKSYLRIRDLLAFVIRERRSRIGHSLVIAFGCDKSQEMHILFPPPHRLHRIVVIMPPKDWKRRATEPSLMQACSWKRLFFSSRQYHTPEALVEAAVMGDMPKQYVESLLQLGHRPRRRRTLTEVSQAIAAEPRPNWLTGLMSSIWLIYSSELNLWKMQYFEESAEVGVVSKRQRQLLRGTGWMKVKRPNLKISAEKRREEARTSCSGRVFCCWVDNFNKFRYSRNPNEERDRCINATVMALIPAGGVSRGHWRGWPTVEEMFASVEGCGRQLHQHHKEFSDRVRGLLARGLRWEQIRVPLDLRRFGVTTMPWMPYVLLDADIKATGGLASAVQAVLGLQRTTMGLCCMLMDVNIFWRLVRLVYCVQYTSCNMLGELADCVPVLGIWHAYAHCVKKVYQHFMPLFAALEVPGFLQEPEHSVVYCKPRLIVMEHMVMGIFLANPIVQADIRSAMVGVEERFGSDSEQMEQLKAMLYLFTEFAPALVEMGISVRQCFWATQEVNTGTVARSVIRDAIVLLQCLCSGGTTEYIRNLVLMDLMWTRLHSALPAAVFVEECLEASLSVLSRRTRTDVRATTLHAFSDIYIRKAVFT